MARDRVRLAFFKDFAWSKWPYCQWCNCRLERSQVTADHVLPRAAGGDDAWENLVISCARCNADRGSAPPPVRAPHGPRWSLAQAEAELAAFKPRLWSTTLRAPLPLPPELRSDPTGDAV